MYNGSFLSIFFAIILHTAGGQSVYSGIRVLIVGLIDLTNSNSGVFLAASNKPGKNTLIVTKTLYAVQSLNSQSFQ